MFQDKNDKHWSDNLNTPQPITPHIEGDFLTLKKQDVAIVKVNVEDIESIHSALRLLNGLLRAGAVHGEIEQVRDLLLEVVGS